MRSVRIIGPGRAGLSLAGALPRAGWEVTDVLGRSDDPRRAAQGVDLVVLATPDSAVERVAAAVEPVPTTAVLHLSGSLGLDVLAAHQRAGSLHPLVPLPDPVTGSERLGSGCFFAVAGDRVAGAVATALGGCPIEVADEGRAAYHAAACIASNHLVALMGQVQRVAAGAGVPLEAFVPLARAALEDVAAKGAAAALTGPVARGDLATVARHREALDPGELAGYDAVVDLATRLVAELSVVTRELEPCR